MTDAGKMNTASAAATGSNWTPVPVLEEIKNHGKVWGELASKYGVTHPDPPWKTSLEGMCEALGAGECLPPPAKERTGPEGSIKHIGAGRTVPLPPLERRCEEDELSESLYQHVPFPERQLLALTHSLIKRGLVNADDIQRRMKEVHQRLSAQ